MTSPRVGSSLRVVRAGMLSSVQDLGRGAAGVGAIGVPTGGAADAWSLRVGNRRVGNPDGAAGIEMTLVGGAFEFSGPTEVVVTGGACAVAVRRCGHGGGPSESRPIEMGEVVQVGAGDVLDAGPITRGARAYLCVAGGIAAPVVLGSRSTELRAAFGGVDGRSLRAGDLLELLDARRRAGANAPAQSSGPPVWHPCDGTALRALVGPDAAASGVAVDALFASEWCVSNRSDRAGVRLGGPPLTREGAGRMISEGMAPGAVQLPPDGGPIVLGVDHPTTGGYPVIAVVASADAPRIGQLRPGARVRFERTTRDEALALFREREAVLDAVLPPCGAGAGGGAA